MRIIRVFPRQTSYTPDDEYAFFDYPPFPDMIPPHDEVHVSCTFTWDKKELKSLRSNGKWQRISQLSLAVLLTKVLWTDLYRGFT